MMTGEAVLLLEALLADTHVISIGNELLSVSVGLLEELMPEVCFSLSISDLGVASGLGETLAAGLFVPPAGVISICIPDMSIASNVVCFFTPLSDGVSGGGVGVFISLSQAIIGGVGVSL